MIHNINLNIKMTVFAILIFAGSQQIVGQDFGLNLNSGAVYGNSCGFAGSQPVLRQNIEEHVKADAIESINEWLESSSEVRQVYAAEALLRLEKEGLTLTTKQNKIIDDLRTSEYEVNTCYGCVYGPQKIKDILLRFK